MSTVTRRKDPYNGEAKFMIRHWPCNVALQTHWASVGSSVVNLLLRVNFPHKITGDETVRLLGPVLLQRYDMKGKWRDVPRDEMDKHVSFGINACEMIRTDRGESHGFFRPQCTFHRFGGYVITPQVVVVGHGMLPTPSPFSVMVTHANERRGGHEDFMVYSPVEELTQIYRPIKWEKFGTGIVIHTLRRDEVQLTDLDALKIQIYLKIFDEGERYASLNSTKDEDGYRLVTDQTVIENFVSWVKPERMREIDGDIGRVVLQNIIFYHARCFQIAFQCNHVLSGQDLGRTEYYDMVVEEKTTDDPQSPKKSWVGDLLSVEAKRHLSTIPEET